MELDTNELCSDCHNPYADQFESWCKECNAKRFQQDFPNWTSVNEFIDGFIRETQLNAQRRNQVLEWIPYNRFKNVKYLDKGGFGAVYEVIWLDGPIQWFDDVKWSRNNNRTMALKNLNKSSNLSEEFLNEV